MGGCDCEQGCAAAVAEEPWGLAARQTETHWPLLWGSSAYLSANAYLAYRGLTVCYWTAILALEFVEYADSHGWKWFIWMTNWALMIEYAWFVFAMVSAFSASNFLRTGDFCGLGEEGKGLPWYVRVAWVCQNISAAAAPIVVVLYWGLLFPTYENGWDDLSNPFLSVNSHGVTCVWMLADVLIANTPLYLKHFYQPAIFALSWTLFGLVYVYLGGTDPDGNAYIYSVLDWKNDFVGSLQLVVPLILVGVPVVYAAVYLLNKEPSQRKVAAAIAAMEEGCSGDLEAGGPRVLMPSFVRPATPRRSAAQSPRVA